MNLKSAFDELNTSRVKYVVVNDNSVLHTGVDPILILCEKQQRDVVLRYLGIEIPNDHKTDAKKRQFKFKLDHFTFLIIESGNDYFPQQFESEMLMHRTMKSNGFMFTPSSRHQHFCDIYRAIVHLNCIENTQVRRSLRNWIEQQTPAVVKCKFPISM